MAELTTLARPYAKAAFEYAEAANDLGGWSKMLAVAADVANHEMVAALLSSPSLTSEAKAEKFAELCGEELNTQGQNFLQILASNQRLSLLPEISLLFELLKAAKEKSLDVEMISAFDIQGDITDKVAKALQTKLNREIRVNTTVDKSLIGGVVIRAGDMVIDGSVKGRLEKLAEAMNS